MPPPPPSNSQRAFLAGLHILAREITKTLQGLFGFQYSRNAEHYIYGATVVSGDADAIGTVYNTSIRVTQEADFIATRLNASTRISTSGTGSLVGALLGASINTAAAGDLPDVPATLQIIDGSTDRQLHSEDVDLFAAYGTWGGLPGVWARPRLFARNTTISLRLTSLKTVPASTNWTYRLVMIGWKIYDSTALDLTSRG